MRFGIWERWNLGPRGPETGVGVGQAEKDMKFSCSCRSVPGEGGAMPCTRTGALPLTLATVAFEPGVGVDSQGCPGRKLSDGENQGKIWPRIRGHRGQLHSWV